MIVFAQFRVSEAGSGVFWHPFASHSLKVSQVFPIADWGSGFTL